MPYKPQVISMGEEIWEGFQQPRIISSINQLNCQNLKTDTFLQCKLIAYSASPAVLITSFAVMDLAQIPTSLTLSSLRFFLPEADEP